MSGAVAVAVDPAVLRECKRIRAARDAKAVIPVGKRFGYLTVLGRKGQNKCGNAMWLVRCDCGIVCSKVKGSVISGRTKSCATKGCIYARYKNKPAVPYETVRGKGR